MRLHLTRSLALLAFGVGILSLLWVPTGAADDVDHNAEVRNRIKQWKARPDADRLFKGVRFDLAAPLTIVPDGPKLTPGTAVALCIGVDHVNNDADHYDGAAPALEGCINDATDMAKILDAKGFKVTSYHDSQATAEAVTKFIEAQQGMKAGDTLVITYSGHGSQVDDISGDEADGKDETLCLYDRMLIDDELFELWKGFSPGVRIVFLADSCHSGTVQRMFQQANRVLAAPPKKIADKSNAAQRGAVQRHASRSRAIGATDLPPAPETHVHRRAIPYADVKAKRLFDKSIYTAFKQRGLRGEEGRGNEIKASLLTFAACQDEETAGEINGHGVFTATLIDVWDGGNFTGNYAAFAKEIQRRVQGQETKFNLDGIRNPAFEGEKPFTIAK